MLQPGEAQVVVGAPTAVPSTKALVAVPQPTESMVTPPVPVSPPTSSQRAAPKRRTLYAFGLTALPKFTAGRVRSIADVHASPTWLPKASTRQEVERTGRRHRSGSGGMGGRASC